MRCWHQLPPLEFGWAFIVGKNSQHKQYVRHLEPWKNNILTHAPVSSVVWSLRDSRGSLDSTDALKPGISEQKLFLKDDIFKY